MGTIFPQSEKRGNKKRCKETKAQSSLHAYLYIPAVDKGIHHKPVDYTKSSESTKNTLLLSHQADTDIECYWKKLVAGT